MSTSPDVHLLVAPYALDALDAHERHQFESHLDHCESCRLELDTFVSTAVRIGEAESAAPPPDLRSRVLAAAAASAQERPVVTALTQRGRLRRALPQLAVAASLLVAALGVTGFLVERDRAEDLRAQTAQVSAVMAAEDVAVTQEAVPTGGALRMIASPSHDAAVVVGSDLEVLDEELTYQVWAMRDGRPASAGVIGPASGMVFVEGIGDAEGFAVTIEPKGGSTSPTSDPIVTMST